MSFLTKDTFTFDHTAQAPYPGWTPLQAQQNLNARGEELRLALNAVVNLLNATTAGASGSENIASATIAGITGNTVYAQIASLLAIAQAAQSGAIVPGSITDTMLSNVAGQIKDIISKATALATASTLALRDANGALTASKFNPNGSLLSKNNTLDDGTGKMTVAGTITAEGRAVAEILSGDYKIQSGSDSIVIATAGTAVTKTVTFPVPFPSALPPIVVCGIQATGINNTSGYVYIGADDASYLSATFKANCYVAQTVFFKWIAIGS